MADHEPQISPPTSFASRHRRWWLPFALAVSLLVHLFLGYTVQRFGLLGTPSDPQAEVPAPGVQVTLLSPSEIKGKDTPDITPQPKAPTPAATPQPPVETPPQKERDVAKPGPTSVPETSAPAATVTPNAPPTPEVQPTPPPVPQPVAPPTNTTGNRPNRVPRPLPLGQENSPAVTPPTPQERPPATQPDVSVSTSPDDAPKASTRLKPNAPTRTPGDAGSGGEIANILTAPKADAPKEELGALGGAGGGDTGGRGNPAAVGAGAADGGNGIGISRGIPFGDVLGLTRRGDPDGGGGTAGLGAGGLDRISGSGGGPRYRIQRPAGGASASYRLYPGCVWKYDRRRKDAPRAGSAQ